MSEIVSKAKDAARDHYAVCFAVRKGNNVRIGVTSDSMFTPVFVADSPDEYDSKVDNYSIGNVYDFEFYTVYNKDGNFKVESTFSRKSSKKRVSESLSQDLKDKIKKEARRFIESDADDFIESNGYEWLDFNELAEEMANEVVYRVLGEYGDNDYMTYNDAIGYAEDTIRSINSEYESLKSSSKKLSEGREKERAEALSISKLITRNLKHLHKQVELISSSGYYPHVRIYDQASGEVCGTVILYYTTDEKHITYESLRRFGGPDQEVVDICKEIASDFGWDYKEAVLLRR